MDYTKFYHSKFALLRTLIYTLYDLKDCSTGGLCHIVIDDKNIYDRDLDFVINECKKPENSNRIDKELSSTICQILKDMTFVQRAIFLEVFNSTDLSFDMSEVEINNWLKTRNTVEEIAKSYE